MIPLLLSSIIISAHFYRHYNYPMMIVSILVPLLLLIKKRGILILIQLFALAGAGVWINTIVVIANERMRSGEPWIRMAVILGAVAAFTLFSGLLLNLKKVKENYH
ncbi:MAG: hypothetical protein Q7U10_11440 [Thermodesulfovibrionia bacterium]|nr:hypothetical protein [Thermodesulfovibrionia bacterium]